MRKLTEKQLSETIKNKFVLFDTNVIINAFKYLDVFKELFDFLGDAEASPIYFPLIEFEFLRDAYDVTHKGKRKEFLREFTFSTMPLPSSNEIEDSIKIANAYTARKINNPSFIDCCIAAYLKKYAKNLFLITSNHKDFPIFLFDRIFIYTLDTEKDIFTIGFYCFNPKKAKAIGVL
jgi:predicted nucleic acid-binding protein